jgi:hypothetical protein
MLDGRVDLIRQVVQARSDKIYKTEMDAWSWPYDDGGFIARILKGEIILVEEIGKRRGDDCAQEEA